MPIRLNLNECPYPPPKEVIEAVCSAAKLLNRYYIKEFEEGLKERLSKYVGVPKECISLLPGSEAFFTYSANFFRLNGLRVLAPKPTFEPAIQDYVVRGVEVIRVLLKGDFGLDPNEVLEVLGDAVVLYVPNPNNPTGNLLIDRSWIKEALEKAAYVVIDEAYYEFSGVTYVDLIKEYPNLLIIRTFSKAFAIAGARVGYVVGSEDALGKVLGIRRVFDIPITSLAAASAALDNIEYMRRYVNEVVSTRDWVVNELSKLKGVEVRNSLTNFILVGIEGVSGEELKKLLRSKGYLVRYLDDPLLKDYVRVSIGTKDEMKGFVEAVKEILNSITTK